MGFRDGVKTVIKRIKASVDATKTSKTVDEFKKMRDAMKKAQGFEKGFEKARVK